VQDNLLEATNIGNGIRDPVGSSDPAFRIRIPKTDF